MTPLFLMDALEESLTPVLANVGLLCGKPFRIFRQNLPPRKVKGDVSEFPYCKIELGDGGDEESGSVQDVVLVFGVRDEDPGYQGYRDILNGIETVREHFLKHPELGGSFEAKLPIRWTLSADTATYPAYFGALLLRFDIPRPQRVSKYL